MKKKPFWYRTSFFVFMYALVLTLVMLFQATINTLIKLEIEINSFILYEFINNNLVMPIDAMAWIWLGIASAYIGVDRTMMFFKNIQTTNDTFNLGSPKTLRKVILVAGLLLLIAIICNTISDANFNLDAFASTFGSTILFYVTGQKAVSTSKALNNKIDTNGDGIADDEQERDENGNIIRHSRKAEFRNKSENTSEDCPMEDDISTTDEDPLKEEIVDIVNHEMTEDEKAMERIKKVFSEPESEEAKEMTINIVRTLIKDYSKNKDNYKEDEDL